MMVKDGQYLSMQKTINKEIRIKTHIWFQNYTLQPIVWLEGRVPYKTEKEKDWGLITVVPE